MQSWLALLRDDRAGYITREEFEQNQRMIGENAHIKKRAARKSARARRTRLAHRFGALWPMRPDDACVVRHALRACSPLSLSRRRQYALASTETIDDDLGRLQALADLLLGALGEKVEETATAEESEHEPEDHA